MKMQIWEVCVSEGIMDAIHGGFHSIHEGFVPELKFTINDVAWFVHDEDGGISRYQGKKEGDNLIIETPDPKMICEIELNKDQIEDVKTLANPEDEPEERIRQVIASALKEYNINNSDYEEKG